MPEQFTVSIKAKPLWITTENRNDALTELVFPAGSEVKNSLFSNYSALKSVTFEGDVELRQGVFYNCNALETVTFKGESTIGGSAFSNCPNIKTLSFEKKVIVTDMIQKQIKEGCETYGMIISKI